MLFNHSLYCSEKKRKDKNEELMERSEHKHHTDIWTKDKTLTGIIGLDIDRYTFFFSKPFWKLFYTEDYLPLVEKFIQDEQLTTRRHNYRSREVMRCDYASEVYWREEDTKKTILDFIDKLFEKGVEMGYWRNDEFYFYGDTEHVDFIKLKLLPVHEVGYRYL